MQREAKREVTAVEGIYIAAKEVTRNKRRGEKKRGGEKKRKCRIEKREREGRESRHFGAGPTTRLRSV